MFFTIPPSLTSVTKNQTMKLKGKREKKNIRTPKSIENYVSDSDYFRLGHVEENKRSHTVVCNWRNLYLVSNGE